MKIITLLGVPISAGGAFHQGINAIQQMSKLCEGKYDFHVVTTKPENLEYLERVNIQASLKRLTLWDKLIIILSFNSIFVFLQNKFKFISSFERYILKINGDIVYFLTQSNHPCLLLKTQFITTSFDICHRDHPEFPEVREFREFFKREVYFKNIMPSASLVITESERLAIKLIQKYGVDAERVIAMPMVPSFHHETTNVLTLDDVMNFYNLDRGYFFYPAQFWPHKNHARIIQSLALLNRKGHKFNCVFAGGGNINRAYLEKLSSKLGLAGQIRFLGFVAQEHIKRLYEGCSVVVMPTYFGPTNIPPLEAWTLQKPLIYSINLIEQAKDAAIYVDPDNAGALAEALLKCTDKEIVDDLVKKGLERLQQIEIERKNAEDKVSSFLQKMSVRMECWDNGHN
jgi:glycosyltransferase involved in cell wall biosynthesis